MFSREPKKNTQVPTPQKNGENVFFFGAFDEIRPFEGQIWEAYY